jgi:purine-cytosine permease-like protein
MKLRRLPFGAKQAVLLLLAIIIVNFGIVKMGSITISKALQQELEMIFD